MENKDILEGEKVSKDIVLAQLRNLVDPLFLSNDVLTYIEKFFSFGAVEDKMRQGTVRRNDISDFIVLFARVLREDIKASGRTVIETGDIDAAFAKVKDRSPF
jgi:hypothetical protein